MHTHRVQLGNQWLPSEVTLDIKKVRTFPIRSIIDGRRARSISTCVFRMRFRFHAISITYDFDNMRFWQLRIIVEDAFLGRCDMFLLVNVTSNDWTSLTASRSEGRAICRIGDHVKNKHQEYVKKVDLAEVKSSLTNLKRKLFSHRAKYFLGVLKCSFIHLSLFLSFLGSFEDCFLSFFMSWLTWRLFLSYFLFLLKNVTSRISSWVISQPGWFGV